MAPDDEKRREAPDPEAATLVSPRVPDPEAAGVDAPASDRPMPSRAPPRASEAVDPDAATVLDTADDPDAPKPDLALPSPALEPGSVLFGEYVVEERIGAGGMGEVYRARHRRLNEARAIKVVRHALGGEDAASRLFDREARALLKISHPAVVRCHDLLSDDDGRVYLIMEFVEGVSLWDRIRARPLEADELRALADRLAAGLSAAHAEGVVHRDLSPDNVVLPDGLPERAKLIDFGIAKELERNETTILEGFKGKLLYASPEQLGFHDGRVAPASDYYSLGLVLAVAACGKSLNMGGTLIQAVEARRHPPELPHELPDDMRRIVRRCLARDPAKRPSSLDVFRIAGGASGPAERRPWMAVAGLAVAALVGAGLWVARDPSDAPALSATPIATQGGNPVAPIVDEPTRQASPPVDEVAPPAAKPQAAKPAPARPRPPSAAERAAALRRELRVEGLLAGARAALEEERLTSPAGDNAVEKYRAVLELDPGNRVARAGLEGVGSRYLELAAAALDRGDVAQATSFTRQAEKLSPKHPKLAATQAALKSAGEGAP